ncbi:hypothetical protein PF005_g11508 [Phytophthora fragariae]|uniref:Uncharacterized protein n=1 Tax=Phytophthora fragariae TaxID=53985 RepID=A0A6A3TYQ5_9STRA|nr:hypothetical protein PF009_g12366 [Phytophthora fragariae]KAE9009877.1 hypothetical protein PF011_g10069 [Phytophthora fragariae]KAE9110778.1 hypothetical protein PF010_g11043 [Phytophthora fragariae]KAE9112267.1 hypothetical protein PF007_g11176 [Phytophthora fragariae]KAE9144293.1 hypothetical protein PF006_g10770 [Phytophthora fragariae]
MNGCRGKLPALKGARMTRFAQRFAAVHAIVDADALSCCDRHRRKAGFFLFEAESLPASCAAILEAPHHQPA